MTWEEEDGFAVVMAQFSSGAVIYRDEQKKNGREWVTVAYTKHLFQVVHFHGFATFHKQ